MNYYILRKDNRVPNQPSVLRTQEALDPEEWLDGKILPDPGMLRFTMSPRSGEFRGGIIDGIVTLYHQRFINILTDFGVDNIQHFPVELENPGGEIEKTYSIVNVIGLIEAVNNKESTFEPRPEGMRPWLNSFRIDPAKVKNVRMFRLVEAPTLVIIDQTIRDHLDPLGIPGIIMLPTEHYNGW